jgi:hypothetical protein
VHPDGAATTGTKAIPHVQEANVGADGGVAWADPGLKFTSGMDSSSSMSGQGAGSGTQSGKSAGLGRSLGPGFGAEGREKVFHRQSTELWSAGGELVVGNKQQEGQMLTKQERQPRQHRMLQDAYELTTSGEISRDAAAAAGTGSSSSSDVSQTSATNSSSGRESIHAGVKDDSKKMRMLKGDLSLSSSQRMLRACFYVWVSAMNLVGISSLWATCADVFSPNAAARLFGCISAGATLGQLFGSLVAVGISHMAAAAAAGGGSKGRSGDREGDAPVLGLLLASVGMQLLAAWLAPRIRRSAPPESARGSMAGSSSCGGLSSARASSSGKAR